jgi:hypothetical protein
LLIRCQVHRNVCIGGYTLRANMKFCLHFAHFRPASKQFGTDDVYKNALSDCEVREDRRC